MPFNNRKKEIPPRSSKAEPVGDIDAESVYDYWQNQLIPAILASLPVLAHRLGNDVISYLHIAMEKTVYFLFPALRENEWSPPSIGTLWNQTVSHAMLNNTRFADFMAQHFDTDVGECEAGGSCIIVFDSKGSIVLGRCCTCIFNGLNLCAINNI